MSGDQLNADVQQYLQAAGLNVTPPSITSDPLVTGGVPIEQLLRILGIAANAGDPQTTPKASSCTQNAMPSPTAAAEQFSAQDENAAAEVSALTPDSSQLAQQVPQLASGTAALAGAWAAHFSPYSDAAAGTGRPAGSANRHGRSPANHGSSQSARYSRYRVAWRVR